MKLREIGHAECDGGEFKVVLDEPYRAGLRGLEGFSHVQVVWWFNGCDNDADRGILTIEKPYTKGPEEIGTFATRSPERPNPIAISTCAVKKTDAEKGRRKNPREEVYNFVLLDNTHEPVVRKGAEPFKSCFAIEEGDYASNRVDPSRSMVLPTLELLKSEQDRFSKWPPCDAFCFLLLDIGFKRDDLLPSAAAAFGALFPNGTSAWFSDSYIGWPGMAQKTPGYSRVLNNPFFYRGRNAVDGKLVEIANESGSSFALDRTMFLPPPSVLAREIALITHGLSGIHAVEEAQRRLEPQIADVFDMWDWVPTSETKACPAEDDREPEQSQ